MSTDCLLLPNLGAEEGEDWSALVNEPTVRKAAELWALLFSGDAVLRTPGSDSNGGRVPWQDRRVSEFWPASLGDVPTAPVYAWMQPENAIVPWYRSASIDASVDSDERARIVGPDAAIVRKVDDKAFAFEAACDLGIMPRTLVPLIRILAPEDLDDLGRLATELSSSLATWPEWTGRRFTLKPRHGSSGRGRVGGSERIDRNLLKGAQRRLAACGGALFEPWLTRVHDLSVSLYLPDPGSGGALPTLLGSLEMMTTQAGVYRGHCGELDHRGRIFSGHREDETLRGHAASVATRAHAEGYYGPCGVDAFSYDSDAPNPVMRPAVEFNARPTMGIVTIGVLRRVLPKQRTELHLEPGERRAFLLGFLPGDSVAAAERISASADCLEPARCLTNSKTPAPSSPTPFLFFAPRLGPLREAYRREIDC